MILRRLGNKKKLIPKLVPLFPPHKVYIETFFGSGSIFFGKTKAQYNIVNDLDSDVFNLFQVVMHKKAELEETFYKMPLHTDLLEYWKKNEETDDVLKACRFLFLSNFTFMGAGASLKVGLENHKALFNSNIDTTFDLLSEVQFLNKDFRKFLKSISFRNELDRSKAFIYNDPPYLGTGDNYSHSFIEQDTKDLFQTLIEKKCKFGISEFDNPIVLELAKQHNLNVHYLGERKNLGNRRTEIYICNYTLNTLF
jgi:DNA adenine methylase